MTDDRNEIKEKRRAILRVLEKLERNIQATIDNRVNNDINSNIELFNLEIKMIILTTFLSHLNSILKDDDYLNKLKMRGLKLEINSKVLDEMDLEDRLSIVCLTAGECGI